MNSTIATPVKKSPGPIRWNAIIPFIIICAVIYAYFFFFFDTHVRKAMEWGAYKGMGVEVNIREFKSSFINGNVKISKIEVTDAKQPEFNSIELGDIRFDVNWDALLRLKFVVQEIAVEGVQFMSKRASPGRVAPPTKESNKPSFTQQLQEKAINKFDKDNEANVLSDVSQFLKSGNFDAQIKNLEGQMASKKMLEDMNAKWAQKKTTWDANIKALPTGAELNSLRDRFGKVKTSNFKTPQELESSLKEIDTLVKEIDSKNKQVNDVKAQLDADLKGLDQDYKSLDLQIKKDIDTLKSRFKIPKIDAASFAKALFMDYLKPITAKVDRYRDMAEKYLPPKYARMVRGDKTAEKDEEAILPHPRDEGFTYEFPIKTGYPLFWIQKIRVSSTSNAQVDYGDFKGIISDVSSNQRQTGKPTTADIKGDFKSKNVTGISAFAELNNTDDEPIVKFNLGVGSYMLQNLELMKSKDGQIKIPSSNTALEASGEIKGFKHYDMRFRNQFNNVAFNVTTADKLVNDILSQTLSAVNKFDLEASARGPLSDLAIDIRSSLGADLQRSFENLLKNKIAEANKQLQESINAEIGKLRGQLDAQTAVIKNQAQGEINKVQAQLNDQKKLADDKINAAKKDAENQAKGKVEQEAQKAIEDAKKRLGF